VTGAAIQSAALGIPFVLAGVVKSLYDLALYLVFDDDWPSTKSSLDLERRIPRDARFVRASTPEPG